ncbi:MAG: glycosyltransferase [Clostridiales bacterium]|jgi:dolichyl-phosphate beta-glucosyltransferase|nr:glycosyltransferase [Clostridiales bacterium]
MKLSVCIPMYNEREICVSTARALYRAMTAFCTREGWDWEILFCDDGSTDDSRTVLQEAIQKEGLCKIQCIGYEQNRGKGAAVRTAVLASTGDIVLYTDCDLAYGTDVIGPAAKKVAFGDKIVLGSRNLNRDGYAGYTCLRRMASKIYIKVIAVCAGFRLTDSQCGFKCFDGTCARRIFSLCTIDGFSFDLEMIKIAQKLGYPLTEFPVQIIHHRDSKIHIVGDALRMLGDIRKIKKHVRNL